MASKLSVSSREVWPKSARAELASSGGEHDFLRAHYSRQGIGSQTLNQTQFARAA